MGNFHFEEMYLKDVFCITPTIYGDERGYFVETYQKREFQDAGIDTVFVQDNQSKSRKGVLRGLHFQREYPQAKLVRVISGTVYDVAVDIRANSATFGKWIGMTLSAENHIQLYLPRGFAHGFLVLSETAEFIYKCDEFYHPESEGGIYWNDPEIGIDWPLDGTTPILSAKDQTYPPLREVFR
ncbi:MAG: dTDP-4-dehydrorhamnose 3,5-epimerase [Eubacteriales bacterium]|nr:dTDP-4-dehydrorhamnose 3,5-epimerase [Eubacteriales bacterium]